MIINVTRMLGISIVTLSVFVFCFLYLSPTLWVSEILRSFFWQLIIILFAGLLILLVSYHPLISASLFLALGLCGVFLVSHFSFDNTVQRQGPNSYSITTFNVYYRNKQYKKISNAIKKANTTVVLLEEAHVNLFKHLQALKSQYPYIKIDAVSDNSRLRKIILSKLPITATKTINISDSGRKSAFINKILFDGLPMTIIGIHLSNPSKPSGFADRQKEYAGIVTQIKRTDSPVMVAGDFNTTPLSYYYDRFLKNSHLSASVPAYYWLPTWYRVSPLFSLPIDHILFEKEFLTPLSITRGKRSGSDHYPITLTFRIKGP